MSGRVNLGKRKLNTAVSFIQGKVARALNVTPEEINLDTSTTEDVDLLQIKAENFDRLTQLIKEKLSTIKTNREIIQVLTLAPETWSIKKVENFFNVTECGARKARSLVQEKGILALPDKKKKGGKKSSQNKINQKTRTTLKAAMNLPSYVCSNIPFVTAKFCRSCIWTFSVIA